MHTRLQPAACCIKGNVIQFSKQHRCATICNNFICRQLVPQVVAHALARGNKLQSPQEGRYSCADLLLRLLMFTLPRCPVGRHSCLVLHFCRRLAGIEAAATGLPDISYFIQAAKISGLFDIVWACESAHASATAANLRPQHVQHSTAAATTTAFT